MSADWLEEADPAVADRDDELEVELEFVVVVEPEVAAVELLAAVAGVALTALTAQFAPSPRKADTARKAATMRDRAAACRCGPTRLAPFRRCIDRGSDLLRVSIAISS